MDSTSATGFTEVAEPERLTYQAARATVTVWYNIMVGVVGMYGIQYKSVGAGMGRWCDLVAAFAAAF